MVGHDEVYVVHTCPKLPPSACVAKKRLENKNEKIPPSLSLTPSMQTPLPEHDLVQPMEDDDEPLGAEETGEDGLLMRMDVPTLHAGAKRFVFMCKGVTERVLDHCNAECRAPEKRYLYGESNAEYEDLNLLGPDGLDSGMAFLSKYDGCGRLLRADGTEVSLDDLEGATGYASVT